MQYRIVQTDKIFIIGVKAEASFSTNGQVTGQLARQFMPRQKEIKNRKDNFSLSLQNYDDFDFKNFSPTTSFEKWIGVETTDLNDIPIGMQSLEIKASRYLVIDFKGSIPEFIKQWQYIHSKWLPASEFELDDRPHFERLSPNYNPMQEVNEEEIWIPIK